MGFVLILLGLAAAGVVADYVVENGLTTAPDHAFQLFGASYTFTGTQVVLAAAIAGALAVALLILGFGLARGSWGRRRGLRRRVRDLELENAALRSRAHLAEVVRVEPAEEGPSEPASSARGDRAVQPQGGPNPAPRR